MRLSLALIREQTPGKKWQALFRRFWPAYREWCYGEDAGERPPRVVAENRLRQTMPELMPTFRRLVELSGNDADVARFLTLYRPAPYLSGCSQAVWLKGEPALVRNYDYSPRLWEAVLLSTNWAGRRVLAMSDCLWGVLDGINDAGLAVSLAFGGRRVVGDGFGCPLLLRYVLQSCRNTSEARAVLERVPTHMAYNITVVDAAGEFFTAYLSPDRPPRIEARPVATNHQEGAGWERYIEATSSLEREHLLATHLEESDMTLDRLIQAFGKPPIQGTRYAQAMGTLYTAIYYPRRQAVELRCGGHIVQQSIDKFREKTIRITLAGTAPEVAPLSRSKPSSS